MTKQQCINKAAEIEAQRTEELGVLAAFITVYGGGELNNPQVSAQRHKLARMEREAKHWRDLAAMHGNARNKIIREGWTVL